MIINKQLINDPFYYKDWNDFIDAFPNEGTYIINEFNNKCKIDSSISGKVFLMYILNNLIESNYPNLKNDFKNAFPKKRLDAVLGIGLWKVIDSDISNWTFNDTEQGKLYEKAL